ncbi:hypothetical protein [Kitasatospora sp. NPDC057015]|uniref:hypothetical protein n=1 Tax=Kitasatospora sp. NPDC057015 TaxID=3346001 RepID=UPI00362FB4F1
MRVEPNFEGDDVISRLEHQAVQSLREGMESAISLLRMLEEKIDGIDSALDGYLAFKAGHRGDVQGNRAAVHRDFSSRFDRFVSQNLLGLVYQATNQRTITREEAAMLVARLCRLFFVPGEVETRRVKRLLRARRGDSIADAVDRTVDSWDEIRDEARILKIYYSWDYAFNSGEFLDPTFQRAWMACDATQVGRFCVAPAYIGDNRLYSLQVVYTAD